VSITLTLARARALKFSDDVDGLAADSTTVQDDALKAAHHAVYMQAANMAPQRFAVEATVTTNASGVGDLSAIDPVRILSLSHFEGVSRSPIPASNLSDGPTSVLGVKTLKLVYIPALTFPATGTDVFTWGQSSLDLPLLDDLMVLRAASAITAIYDEPNAHLERLIARAEKDAQMIANFSTWRVMPLRGRSRDSGLCYVMTDAVSLQLVRG
jgi:hypothetical protein